MRQPQDRPTTVVMVVDDETEVVVGSLAAFTPSLELVDALARMRLLAHRRGWEMQVRDVPGPLLGLLELVGLADVVGARPRPPLG